LGQISFYISSRKLLHQYSIINVLFWDISRWAVS
jgi:hypothetical protein